MIKDCSEKEDLVLLSCNHDVAQNKLFLKMYNPHTETLNVLETADGFIPYTYFKLTDPNFDYNTFQKFIQENKTKYDVQITEMNDLIEDIETKVLKLYSSNVFFVYEKLSSKLNDVQQYEYLIKYHESYVFEKQLIFSSNYDLKNKTLYEQLPKLTELQDSSLKSIKHKMKNDSYISLLFSDKESSKTVQYWRSLDKYTYLLNQDIPDFKRVAIDIEVLSNSNKLPDVIKADSPIISVAFVDNRGKNLVVTTKEFLYNLFNTQDENIINPVCLDLMHESLFDFIILETELDLIEFVFKKLNEYPIVVTFNGDNFDLAYINQRWLTLKGNEEKNPIIFKQGRVRETANHLEKNPIYLKNSIHLDLFHLYKNISLQNYAFGAKYKSYGLDAISEAMLGRNKLEFDLFQKMDSIKKTFNETKIIRYDVRLDPSTTTLSEMYQYNLHDSKLTMELTTFSNNLTMNLIIILSRITKTSIEDICRYGISNWARSMLYFEHRKRHAIIPTGSDLAKKGTVASVESVIKGKGFKGAFVLESKAGVFFNVTALDLGSMYPSIIKSFNLSYETINCGHRGCQSRTDNKIEGTKHYTCTQKLGLLSLLIGVFRDLRLGYFKKLGKQEDNENKEFFKTVEQAIKVLLNGTYGVLGSEAFNMFCLPVAESVTAIGRHIITTIIDYAEKELGLNVIISDTDSIYVVEPTKEHIEKLIEFTYKKFGIDLEVDKEYRYIMTSGRKKNYLGVTKKGTVDVKGLTGKKSNIPAYIKNCFNDVTTELSKVRTKEELDRTLNTIKDIIKQYMYKLQVKKDIKIDDLVFKLMINRDVNSYGKVKSVTTDINNGNRIETKVGIPQQIKIAMEMAKNDESLDISEKSIISFIKTKDGYKLPKEVKTLKNIDTEKYLDTLRTALLPILETLGIDFENLQVKSQYHKTLDDIFGQQL
jgi:DNA polymerase I